VPHNIAQRERQAGKDDHDRIATRSRNIISKKLVKLVGAQQSAGC